MVKLMTGYEPPIDIFASPRRESAVELVVNRIKNLLLSGQLRPGDRLPTEIEIAKSLSVSRNSVREGMKILEAIGIVEILRGDGTYIRTSMDEGVFEPLLFSLILTRAQPVKMIELREMIEVGVCNLIIKNAEPNDIANIRTEYLKMENKVREGVEDPVLLTKLDIAFHRAMAKATLNPLVERIYNFILEYFEFSIQKTYSSRENRVNVLRLHREIIEALESHNLERTVAAIKESITDWINRTEGI